MKAQDIAPVKNMMITVDCLPSKSYSTPPNSVTKQDATIEYVIEFVLTEAASVVVRA